MLHSNIGLAFLNVKNVYGIVPLGSLIIYLCTILHLISMVTLVIVYVDLLVFTRIAVTS